MPNSLSFALLSPYGDLSYIYIYSVIREYALSLTPELALKFYLKIAFFG